MIDGVFVHYLVKEFQELVSLRINKFGSIKDTDFYLTLQNKKTLLFSLNSNLVNVRLTNQILSSNLSLPNFHKLLKKYLESSIIKNIHQHNNDRIIIFDIDSFDELGYLIKLKLIFELFGRNANLILTNNDDIIIDCYKRCFEDKISDRVIIPKAKYSYPLSNKINPYLDNSNSLYNLEGVSNLLQDELEYQKNKNIINNDSNPVLIKQDKKYYFYAFDLLHIDGVRTYFNSLSELLDNYQLLTQEETKNDNQLLLFDKINKEITKLKNKLSKQKNELEIYHNHLVYEQIGNILASNIHLVKKGDKEIKCFDFYNNQDIIINLDPLITPNENLKGIFAKYQKAKRGINEVTKQIELTNNDITYYNCLLSQIEKASKNDYLEIYEELKQNRIINKELKSSKAKKAKPCYLTFTTNNHDKILVGKNNIQNNYITHTLAKDYDYFFHVQNVPGSHVIVKTEELTDELINLAACIAAYYSSYSASTNVCVDYCLVKYVRKVPGMKGSFVTYKNFKSVFAKPDLDYIKKNTIQ